MVAVPHQPHSERNKPLVDREFKIPYYNQRTTEENYDAKLRATLRRIGRNTRWDTDDWGIREMRRALKRLRLDLGSWPACFGWFKCKDPQCEGTPCVWGLTCRTFMNHCAHLQIDVERYKRGTGQKAILALTWGVLSSPKIDRPFAWNRQFMVRDAWLLFLKTFTEHCGLPVLPQREMANYGELYVREWRVNSRWFFPWAWVLRARTGLSGRSDYTLARYWPNSHKKIMPIIEIATHFDDIRALLPDDACEQWDTTNILTKKASDLGVIMRRCNPAHIAAIADAMAKMFMENKLRGMVLHRAGGRVIACPVEKPKGSRKPFLWGTTAAEDRRYLVNRRKWRRAAYLAVEHKSRWEQPDALSYRNLSPTNLSEHPADFPAFDGFR